MNKLKPKDYLLSIQHLFAMFGATVLVPLLTGINPAVALVSAGIGTWIFHICTKFKVPVFLGSSFAFIAPISTVIASYSDKAEGVQYVQGGIIFAGALYLIFALLAYLLGPDKIKQIFPPVVTGPVIIVIGIGLSYSAVNDAFGMSRVFSVNNDGVISSAVSINWKYVLIALFTLAVVIGVTIFTKGFFRIIPILIGMASGYVLCMILDAANVIDIMDYSKISNAEWINVPFKTLDANGVPFFSLPKFDFTAIITIAPVALVTFMEHIGDITTNGSVVKKDFFKDPGLHRTLLGDGLATAFAGLIGGPANTTYSENTGVLATTKNYNPLLLRITAIFAIILGFFGKFGAVLQTIPGPVKGGVSIILFGMIAAVGIRTLAEANLDFTHSRNLIIVGLILVVGIGINIATYDAQYLTCSGISLSFGDVNISLSGLFVAVIVGVLANLILPNVEDKVSEEK